MEEQAGGQFGPAVVVGVDGSLAAWDALAWAAAEASATGRPLRVVYVVEWPAVPDISALGSIERATAMRIAGIELVAAGARRARAVAANLVVLTQVELGDVAEALMCAATHDAMIVLGQRRASRRWWRLQRRSTALAVARHARCPVAVVELMGDACGDYAGRVVVLDEPLGEESPVMLFARSAATHRSTDVVVLEPGSAGPPHPAGAALVVLGSRRSERLRRRMSVAAIHALVTATGPTVVVPA